MGREASIVFGFLLEFYGWMGFFGGIGKKEVCF